MTVLGDDIKCQQSRDSHIVPIEDLVHMGCESSNLLIDIESDILSQENHIVPLEGPVDLSIDRERRYCIQTVKPFHCRIW